MFENASKTAIGSIDNVSVVSYRNIQHASRSYGASASTWFGKFATIISFLAYPQNIVIRVILVRLWVSVREREVSKGELVCEHNNLLVFTIFS